MAINKKDQEFLESIQAYVERRPEVAAYISGYVAQGIDANRREQIEKSADMEVIISFLMRGGKLKPSDKQFVVEKLEKWNHLNSLSWTSLIERFNRTV